MHTESFTRALQEAGHQVDTIAIPFKWYPPAELIHQMALWRSLDLSEAGGVSIDMVIALRFPGYLVRHERKVVWLIHQHRTAYDCGTTRTSPTCRPTRRGRRSAR